MMSQLPSSSRSALALTAFILVTFSAPVLGVLWPPGEWYEGLSKPSWNPPAWIFGPVWTVLYLTMAVAAWLVWRQGELPQQRKPLTRYFIQLALNAAWTPIFFGAHQLFTALVVIVFLWVTLLITLLSFHRVNRLAGWLLLPYLAWVAFATALNGALWWLNR